MMSKNDNNYGYHIYLFPFTYSMELTSHKICENNYFKSHWVYEKQYNINDGVNENNYLDYNRWQYFFPKARRILFENEEFSHYRYAQTEDSIGKYIIRSNNGDVSLDIVEMKLLINERLQIGTFSLTCTQKSVAKGEDYKNACMVNDMGRRIFAPSYAIEEDKLVTNTTAQSLEFLFINGESICIDYSASSVDEGSLIERLLWGSDFNVLKIKPILDDRMFVMSFCIDDEYTDKFVKVSKALFDTSKAKTKNDNDEKNLYEYIFADRFGECTCQDPVMRRKLLESATYLRWMEFGTIYGITEYSFVGMANSNVPSFIVSNFITEYKDMTVLALLQRSMITMLESEASELAERFWTLEKDSNEAIETIETLKERLDSINVLWKKYVYFQNVVFTPEISFQQQATELYFILKESLKIDLLNSRMNGCMANLHEYEEIQSNALLHIEAEDKREKDKAREKKNKGYILIASTVISFLLILEELFCKVWNTDNSKKIFIIIEVIIASGVIVANAFIYHYEKKSIKESDK